MSLSSTVSPTIITTTTSKLITVAAGCFWGVEHIYKKQYHNKGLIDAKVGFSNGNLPDPSYKRVCEGDTNYAEVLQISYEPSQITLIELISFFYKIHDPTTVDSQGPDQGTQYRSAIFYHYPEDLSVIEQVTKEYQTKWKSSTGRDLVTKIEPIKNYYDAEDYHQAYLENNPQGYHCPSHFIREL
ncbi:hypothetical protein WICPIJ_005898 [Wickerhamomyces pijperi]|uniref:peptide-methionine (S)-S-oxide reductase n=1 Tax=Wickerhamomyces pijperi TaxID=599730 RepID=A0A9P8Q535_WICPI|nr:hypothetical protein WICPIJ_005898 [Wickerhamomyces pijperi]